ncbi:MAG: hypothetical protein ACI9AR_000116 [Flavobacteriaceae bacterium]|jgi:hypothetical protein
MKEQFPTSKQETKNIKDIDVQLEGKERETEQSRFVKSIRKATINQLEYYEKNHKAKFTKKFYDALILLNETSARNSFN